jgi:aminoglycoside phosphotransferase (APT) family kinase protein
MTTEWFEEALRPSRVIADLSGAVPEFTDGSLALLRCRIGRVRPSIAGNQWTAVYEIDVRDTATGVVRTCVARGVIEPPGRESAHPLDGVPFGTDGWGWVAPGLGLHLVAVTVDSALPGLAVLTDPEQGGVLVQSALRSAGALQPGVELAGFSTEVLTHKAGVRATVLCRLRYGGDGATGPAAVIAKIHHDDQGARSFASMQALTRPSCALTERVHLPRPLAFMPDLRVSIQEYVPSRATVKDLFHEALDSTGSGWDDLLEAIRTTAAGLAALHRRRLESGHEASWDDELATLRHKQAKLAAVLPAAATRTSTVPQRLESAAAATSADPLVPSHHSFRPAQVLLTGSGITFIDFDKVCRAEPACDLALFTAKLRHMAANKVEPAGSDRQRTRRVAMLREEFLEEYQRHAPVSVDRVHLWEALELTSLVHSAAKKLNADWMDRCEAMLEEHLASCGW